MRRYAILALVLMMAFSSVSSLPWAAGYDGHAPGRGAVGPGAPEPDPVWDVLDSATYRVEVPPGEVRVLRANATSRALEPVDWPDPLAGQSITCRQAVASVEPWLRDALAANLQRLLVVRDAFARAVRDCPNASWRDEVAFAVAHTPPEILVGVSPTVLTTNARLLYEQDAAIPYADIVERSGEGGNYTTVSYVNLTGARWELPRDVYYFYLAHPRVFWEDPAAVAGHSFWRKAFFDELSYPGSGTLEQVLGPCSNYVEAIQAATVWVQRNLEFGYGTNYVQPVEVIIDRFGSCGEYSIACGAALRVAMVPSRVTIYTASDHQWNELWMDGAWTFMDASNDVAGAATVREPELINRTNAINLNDPDVFERTGWKPFMSMTNSFRPDDVDINSIGIRNTGPRFNYGGGAWTVNASYTVHKYTDTTRVHVTVLDAQGDPVEGAWVGVLELAHDPYNVNSFPVALFASANYTNATGQCDLDVGAQGTCRWGHTHSYTVEVLSDYGNKGAVYPGDMPVTQEGIETNYLYTVGGNAPHLLQPEWDVIPLELRPAGVMLNLSIHAAGVQRHVHGEYGGHEMFTFGTGFDHEFAATVDCAVMYADGLRDLLAGGRPDVVWGMRDIETAERIVPVHSEWEDAYVVLYNKDSYLSTKVVELGASFAANCRPRVEITTPSQRANLTTERPVTVGGTVRDHSAVVGLCATLDGANWTDIADSLAGVAFEAALDASELPSGHYHVTVRATDALGVWREAATLVYLDADDPVIDIATPAAGGYLDADDIVVVSGSITDNRKLVSVRARLGGYAWQVVTVPGSGEVTGFAVLTHDEVGPATIGIEATDVSGRVATLTIPITLDPFAPDIQVVEPDPGKVKLFGNVTSVTIDGSVWDDYGVGALRYRVDDGGWTDALTPPASSGRFTIEVDASLWGDGLHRIELLAVDLAGHTDHENVTVRYDATPPELDVVWFQDTFTDKDRVELRGSATDANGLGALTASVDGGEAETFYVDPYDTFLLRLPEGTPAIGDHSVRILARDVVGNVAELVLRYTVVDVTLPRLTIDDPADATEVAWGETFQVSGTADDNAGVVRMSLKVGDREELNITDHLVASLGWWDVTVPTADLPLGTVVVEVVAWDAAGNQRRAVVDVVLVDRTDPTCSLLVAGAMPEVRKGVALAVAGSATDEAGVVLVQYRIDEGPWFPVQGALVGDALNFTVPTDLVEEGVHLLSVRVADAAGNDATASMTFSVVVPEEGGMPGWALGAVAAGLIVVVVLMLLVMLRRDRLVRATSASDQGLPSEQVPGSVSEEASDPVGSEGPASVEGTIPPEGPGPTEDPMEAQDPGPPPSAPGP